jgi:hypothetical protein
MDVTKNSRKGYCETYYVLAVILTMRTGDIFTMQSINLHFSFVYKMLLGISSNSSLYQS